MPCLKKLYRTWEATHHLHHHYFYYHYCNSGSYGSIESGVCYQWFWRWFEAEKEEEEEEDEEWLDHTKTLQKGLCLRLGLGLGLGLLLWVVISWVSDWFSISHITLMSWYSQVSTSLCSFNSPPPFLRALTREARASQTRRTGKTILCHNSISFFFVFFLTPPPLISLIATVFNPARPPPSRLGAQVGMQLSVTSPITDKDRSRLRFYM